MVVFANVLQPLIDVAHSILLFFHDQLGFGWGAAIIGLTVVVRVLILPLTFKGVRSMQAMQALQPEMKKIQTRYRDDRERMNKEMIRFYQENEVNPLASCMPLLLQLPAFISLFYLLRSSQFKADIQGEESFLFIPNLAQPMTEVPGVLVVLLILYVSSQLAAGLVTAVTADRKQRILLLALPFMIVPVVIFGQFEFGLMVYWITTNVWTVGQQFAVKKLLPTPQPLDREPDAEKEAVGGRRAAQGKPAASAALAGGAGAGSGNGRAAKGSAGGVGDGRPAKAPPRSPRKKKRKRSGRRR